MRQVLLLAEFNLPNLSDLGEGTDWQDSVINDAPLSNQNLSISGGTDSSKYYSPVLFREQKELLRVELSLILIGLT